MSETDAPDAAVAWNARDEALRHLIPHRELAQLDEAARLDEPVLDRVAVVDERVVVDRLLQRVRLAGLVDVGAAIVLVAALIVLVVDVAAHLRVEQSVELEAAPRDVVRDAVVEARVAAADLDDRLLAGRIEADDRHAPLIRHAVAHHRRAPLARRRVVVARADGDENAVVVDLEHARRRSAAPSAAATSECTNALPYIVLRSSPTQRYEIVAVRMQLRLNSAMWCRERSAVTPSFHEVVPRRKICASSVAFELLPTTVPAFCHCDREADGARQRNLRPARRSCARRRARAAASSGCRR